MLVSVEHREGDALDTYLEAVAAANAMTLRAVFQRTGLVDDRGRLPALWGAVATERHAKRLANTIGIDTNAMTLTRFHPHAVDLTGLDPDHPTSIRTVLRRQWLHVAGSRYCPDCLTAGRHWSVAWKLPWSFACTTHRTWLHDVCPDCQRRPRTYTAKGTTQPSFTTIVPDPNRCPNSAGHGRTGAGRAATPCGADLRRVESVRCPTDVVATQRAIRRWFDSSSVDVLGETTPTRSAFHTLQAVCVWLDAAEGAQARQRPWLTPPERAIDIGQRTRRAIAALDGDFDTAAEQLALPLASLLKGAPSARTALRERVARNALSDELADTLSARFERTSTRQRRRATQLLLPLNDTTVDELIAAIDTQIDYPALRDLTGVDNRHDILRDAVIIDVLIAAGANTAAHASDLANLRPGAVKRNRYIHRLINQANNRRGWLAQLDRLTP